MDNDVTTMELWIALQNATEILEHLHGYAQRRYERASKESLGEREYLAEYLNEGARCIKASRDLLGTILIPPTTMCLNCRGSGCGTTGEPDHLRTAPCPVCHGTGSSHNPWRLKTCVWR